MLSRLSVWLSVVLLSLPGTLWAACVDVSSASSPSYLRLALAYRVAVLNGQSEVPSTTPGVLTDVCFTTFDPVPIITVNALETEYVNHLQREQADQQLQTDFETEIAANDLCTATLAEIDSRIDTTRDALNTDISAIGNLAQARTVMTSMNNTYAAAFKKVARCLKARLR